MSDLWEHAFTTQQTMWGLTPTASAALAAQSFEQVGVKSVLVPGVGYGRNAKAFLDRGMMVTGIEVSATAIAIARSEMALTMPIHHGSVADMPFDHDVYDAVFCFGLIYLLDANGRDKLLRDCTAQLKTGGRMVFTVISKDAPMYGQGKQLGEDWYERFPNMPMYFYDGESVVREFGPYGLVEQSAIGEPMHNGTSMPFIQVICVKP